MWGKDLLEGDKGLDPAQSALLFVTFFLLVYVGTLAAQVTRPASQPASHRTPICMWDVALMMVAATYTNPITITTMDDGCQIAGRAFDEAKREALMAIAVEKGGSSSGWDEGMEDGQWDWFTMLGIERPKVRACVRAAGRWLWCDVRGDGREEEGAMRSNPNPTPIN